MHSSLTRFVVVLLILGCIPLYWFWNQERGASIQDLRARNTLKLLFRECAQYHALFARAMNMDDIDTLETRDKYILFGCVAEAAVENISAREAQALLASLVKDYPEMREPGAAAYLLPALYRAASYEAAEYLLEHTAADAAAELVPSEATRFKGLTLPQYHAYYRRLNIADLAIRHGAILAPEGSRFRHWIYENQSARLTDPKLNEFLEKHGIPIDEQDEMGRTVLLRAMQDGDNLVATHLINLGADPTVKDQRNQTAGHLLAKARGAWTMETPPQELPPEIAAISPVRFSLEQNLRAEPLALNSRETLFLYDDEGRTRAERWNWASGERHTVRLPLPAKSRDGKVIRYATVETRDGLWVLGPMSVLVTRDDGIKELRLQQAIDQGDFRISALTVPYSPVIPSPIALDDGSLLVFGLERTRDGRLAAHRLYLRDRDRAIAEFRELSPPAGLRSEASAARLRDGRVLIVGGSRRQARQAWLYDPQTDSWRATGDMNSKRLSPAIAVLPDGRVLVAGNSGTVSRDSDSVTSAELWDPQSGQWSSLPVMPLSFGIKAHRARGPSAAVLSDGSLVVGGGMHNQVLRLRPDGEAFAAQWTVADSIPRQRVGATLQALDDNQLAILGGLGLSPDDRCCWTRSGGTVLDLDIEIEHSGSSIGLVHREPAIAHRRGHSFVAGGWARYSLSSETVQASAVAELIDHDLRRVDPLTWLPSPMLYGRAIWIDDDRILLKSVSFGKQIRSELSDISIRSLESDYRGYLAVYRISTGRWQVLDDTRISGAELAGLIDNEAILVGPGVSTWTVDVNKFTIREMRERIAVRAASVARTSRDGRIIVAGGRAQTFFIRAADIYCMEQNCPLRWFSAGGLGPADRYEIWEPWTRRWRFSAIKQVAAEEAVIRRDGRVVTLGWSNGEWRFEASSADGNRWHMLPRPVASPQAGPAGASLCGRPEYGASLCRLVLGVLPAGHEDRVFLIIRHPGRNSDSRYSLWLYSDPESRWLSVARDLTEEQLNATVTLPEQGSGGSLKAAYFATEQARLWRE